MVSPVQDISKIGFSTVQITIFRHCEGVLARSNLRHNSEIASPPKARSTARNDGYTVEKG